MPSVLVVGAGFAGCTAANVLARAGYSVTVIDRREHIGGNAYDKLDRHGVLIHLYGPHIFHTSDERVAEYLSRFTDWHAYKHRVQACVDGKLYPIPINQDTINRLYALDLDESGVIRFLESVREPRKEIVTSEDVVLSTVGRDLCDKFFRGYTRKQWGLDLSELSASVASRVPVRTNRDSRYFSDKFQKMPARGFTALFENMLRQPNITVELGTDFEQVRGRCNAELVIYTGPIDAYFGFCFGRLPYRSLRFEHEHIPALAVYQPVAVVNYPNRESFTRITEFKHMTAQQHSGTSIVREYACADREPYYPVPQPANQALYQRYAELAERERSTIFLGRLAQYRYYNMDQVVGAVLDSMHARFGINAGLAYA